MMICNNTPNSVEYWVSSATSSDCGSLDPSQTTDLPGWDNQDSVKVTFQALPPEQGVTAFSVTIPESKTGMAVTIGLYQE